MVETSETNSPAGVRLTDDVMFEIYYFFYTYLIVFLIYWGITNQFSLSMYITWTFFWTSLVSGLITIFTILIISGISFILFMIFLFVSRREPSQTSSLDDNLTAFKQIIFILCIGCWSIRCIQYLFTMVLYIAITVYFLYMTSLLIRNATNAGCFAMIDYLCENPEKMYWNTHCSLGTGSLDRCFNSTLMS